ncbi:hypothetical protein ABK040_009710 [Willaertia magna]
MSQKPPIIIPITFKIDKKNKNISLYHKNKPLIICDNEFSLIFLSNNEQYLINNLQNEFKIIAFCGGIFMFNKLNGQVYFKSSKMMDFTKLKKFGFIFNENLHLLKFTIKEPIKKIVTKFSNYFVMLTKSGRILLFSKFYKKEFTIDKFNYEKIVKIACGDEHVLILTENNTLYGYGKCYDGALSYNNHNEHKTNDLIKCNVDSLKGKIIKEIVATNNCSFILTNDNDLFVSGGSYGGENGLPKDLCRSCLYFTKIKENIEKVIAGYYFAAIKTLQNDYFIFGEVISNPFGEVEDESGYCANRHHIYGTNFKLNTFNNVLHLTCGRHYSVITTNENKIFMAGIMFNNLLNRGNYGSYKKYTEIKFNYLNLRDFKVKAGYDFTIINSKRKINFKFNFSDAYKISDISFQLF